MTLHADILRIIEIHLEQSEDALCVSPTSLALAVMRAVVDDVSTLPPALAYSSLEHFKQLSRRAAGRKGSAGQGELFAWQLQQRYPLPPQKDQPAAYKLRWALTEAELQWNITQLAKSGAARLAHSRALQAYADDKAAGDDLMAA